MRPVDGAIATNVSLSRRGILAGAAAVAGAGAAVALGSGSAEASEAAVADFLPPIRPYTDTVLPTRAVRNMANRFTGGYTPALRRQMKADGGALAWFEKQLHPGSIADPIGKSFDSWWPTRDRTSAQHFEMADMSSGYVSDVVHNHGRWTLMRRAFSTRQVHEVMSEFWLNHLHVYSAADITWTYRTEYDTLIRKYALGRYEDMLQAAVVHPCMLTFLDGDLSMVKPTRTGIEERLNENLGREVLELHTVGRGTPYTEDDVKDSARILTGYHIDRFDTWAFTYDTERHYVGEVEVLGFKRENANPDGRGVLREYLTYLAHHPATAQRIARKLAVRFCSDRPSDALVDELATVFLDSGTDIKTTLRALVRHPEFLRSAGQKIRTPVEDVVASMRKLGVQVSRPVEENDAANMMYYVAKSVGQVPFGWSRPDGFPDVGSVWTSGGRMMGSFRVHYTMSGGFWPSRGAVYRRAETWLPQPNIRFDSLVDHLCRTLNGEPSTSLLLGAASIAVDVAPEERITVDHVLVHYRMHKLLGILLDTQQHLTR